MISICKYESPLGTITIAGSEAAVTGLWFDGQKYFGAGLPKEYGEEEMPVFKEARRWLDLYFAREIPGFLPPLKPAGTEFRREVWNLLLVIPYGQTVTYGELAAKIAAQRGLSSMSAQAVGGAVGHNPVSLMIPCHRVIGTGGNLTGYAGGTHKKAWLLAMECEDKGEKCRGKEVSYEK